MPVSLTLPPEPIILGDLFLYVQTFSAEGN